MTKKDNRGGVRPGAGRPATEHPKRSVTFRVDNDLLEFVNSAYNRSELINRALRELRNKT